MGKRSKASLCRPQEAKQYSQLNYDKIIQEAKKEKYSPAPVITPVSMELPDDLRIQSCWRCGGRNEQGWCQNYLLHAVLQDKCRLEVVNELLMMILTMNYLRWYQSLLN